MNAVAQVFAVVEAVIYIVVFPLEAFFVDRPSVLRFLRVPSGNVKVIKVWAFSVGWRNFFLGAGVITGVALLNVGRETIGATLVVFCCLNMVLSAWLMYVSDLLGQYPKRGDSVPGVLAASVPAFIALIVALF